MAPARCSCSQSSSCISRLLCAGAARRSLTHRCHRQLLDPSATLSADYSFQVRKARRHCRPAEAIFPILKRLRQWKGAAC